MSKYILYSGATDITGKALAEALHLTGRKTMPILAAGDIVIGWGVKTDDDININNNVHVLNHPNKIRANRNKLSALKTMKDVQVLANAVAPFVPADAVASALSSSGNVTLPLVGRTMYHQGGKGFWLCLTKSLVAKAVADGAQYFQNFIDIKDEYRLHVAFGKVIHAVKKIPNASEASWTAQRKEKIEDYAQKNNISINGDTLNYVLKRLFKEAVLPDMIVRSNKRGWKFSNVQLGSVSAALKNTAIASVKALGLDFGAVDCAVSNDNNSPYIIEVNSGPGLQGTALEKYIAAFTAKITVLEVPAPVTTPAPQTQAAGVGAQNAEDGDIPLPANPAVPAGGMVTIMNNVKTDAEAQAVIALIMANSNG
jgi:hypothetical protein